MGARTETAGSALMRRRSTKVAVDVMLLVGFIAAFATHDGPEALHSWIGIVVVPVVAVHLLGNLAWIRRVMARRRADREWSLGLLNSVFAAVFAACTISGFPVWLSGSDSGMWEEIHDATGGLAMLIMLYHLWRNRSRIVRMVRSVAA